MPLPSVDFNVHRVGERPLGVGDTFLVTVCFRSYVYTQFGPVSRESIPQAGLNISFLS